MDALAAVIWDMDGTLIDSAEVVPAAFISCVTAAGGPTLTTEDVIAAYGVGPPAAILGHFLGRPPSPPEIELFYTVLTSTASGVLRPFPGVPQVLHVLSKRTRLAVFTGGSRRAARILLRAAGLLVHFELVVGGDEVALAKPAPDGLLETCTRLGLDPGQCAYVGDSALDLEAAFRAGVRAVAARWGHLFDEQSSELADTILDDPAAALSLLDN